MAAASMTASDQDKADERKWYIVSRWLEYEGESRANLLRIVAVAAFYGVQLVQFHLVRSADEAAVPFHKQATALAVAWTMLALAVTVCLRRQIFPAALKYVSTAGDIVLLSALAWLAGGPESSITRAFFLIIALSALRFDLGLVWFSTLGCMVAYEALVGRVDSNWFDANHTVPVVDNLIMLVSLALTGLIIGQVIRRSRHAAADYAHRLQAKVGRK